MHPTNASLSELLIYIAYLSFPVWCIARMLQWLMLKNFMAMPKLVGALIVSLVVSFIVTIVLWGGWPGNPMYSIIAAPALCAEGVVLMMTYLIKKNLIKK